MAVTYLEISHRKRSAQHTLALDLTTQAALAEIARERWPVGTAKLAARAWGLTLDQARSMVAGRASQSTVDHIMKTGGWPLYFDVGSRVLGHGADQFLARMRDEHEERAARLGELVGDLRWLGSADPAAGASMARGARREPVDRDGRVAARSD